jgi:hypothetical protein
MKLKMSDENYNYLLNNKVIVTNKTNKIKPKDKIVIETKTKMSIVEVDSIVPPTNDIGLMLNFGIVKIK